MKNSGFARCGLAAVASFALIGSTLTTASDGWADDAPKKGKVCCCTKTVTHDGVTTKYYNTGYPKFKEEGGKKTTDCDNNNYSKEGESKACTDKPDNVAKCPSGREKVSGSNISIFDAF